MPTPPATATLDKRVALIFESAIDALNDALVALGDEVGDRSTVLDLYLTHLETETAAMRFTIRLREALSA